MNALRLSRQILLTVGLISMLLTACAQPTAQPPTSTAAVLLAATLTATQTPEPSPTAPPEPTETQIPIPSALPPTAIATTVPLTPPSPLATATPPATLTPIANATANASPTPAAGTVLAGISVVSAWGAVIYRGPGYNYEVIGTLFIGKPVSALGRNQSGKWIQIQYPPGQSKKYTTGWIHLTTTNIKVNGGTVQSLPVAPYTIAAPVYLENCTKHHLLVLPGFIKVDDSTTILLYPGEFKIYDIDVPNDPLLRVVILTEGQRVRISDDGRGKSYVC